MAEIEQLLDRVAAETPKALPWGRTSLSAPASADAVARAEAALGFALPPLLTALDTRIADGGIGPAYGLLTLDTAVVKYRAGRDAGRKDPVWPWPEDVLPVSGWGCAMLACVDCRVEDAPVLLYEPDADETDHARYVDAPSLETWLRTWLDGTGWYADEDGIGDDDMPSWPDFAARARI
ncbi:SMI1/KNR4 family protein [Streptomyces sp. NPDC002133]|uniref:SMI1/KNR4 family protein n=1 Tax=Streptomyces sp. NPDC002133 TaxID=3154409 RepID=UPI003327074B